MSVSRAPRPTADLTRALQLVFDDCLPELERWIREVGDGIQVDSMDLEGNPKKLTVKKNPYRAAELMIRLAEYCSPKLAKHDVGGPDGGPLTIEVKEYSE